MNLVIMPKSASVTRVGTMNVRAIDKDTTQNPVRGVAYQSSDRTVATVDGTGRVSGVKAGTATITAVIAGQRANCALTVLNSVHPRTIIVRGADRRH
jgi:uncharacterized protein YjdB